jgi:hypothetical protein
MALGDNAVLLLFDAFSFISVHRLAQNNTNLFIQAFEFVK